MNGARIISGWEEFPSDAASAGYLKSLIAHGASVYVENANLAVKALSIDGQLLPLVINPGERRVSDVCSPYAHYILYTVEEFCKSHSPFAGGLFRGVALPFGAFLRCCRIDRVLFINNWLFTTNPTAALSLGQIAAATDLLRREYPDCAIVFRSVNSLFDQESLRSLSANGYRLIRSREVYVIDCASRRALQHNNIQIDLKLLKRSPYRVADNHEFLQEHASRMADLYRSIYLSKHSLLNPRFSSDFFRITLKEHTVSYRALERDGRIDGFVSFFTGAGRMTGAVLGYDRDMPRHVGLYRMLIAILISEAAEHKLHLNLSGGARRFKLLRGAEPIDEYDAVYDRHLSTHRRLPWAALKAAGSLRRGRGV